MQINNGLTLGSLRILGTLYADTIKGLANYNISLTFSTASVVTTDTVDIAFSKLLKLINSIITIVGGEGADTDNKINQLREVYSFLDNITETDNILTKFVTLGTTQTISGAKTFTGQVYINLDQDVGNNLNGSLVIGPKGGTNIGIDGNEIQARNNSVVSSLYLNADGATNTVHIGNSTLGSATKPIYVNSGVLTEGTELGTMAYKASSDYLPLTGGTLTGDLTLSSSSGDSPHLIFRRGSENDSAYDWDLYVSGGYFYLRLNDTKGWHNILKIHPDTATGLTSSYQVNAPTFNSTVKTGTAPFTVASTTKVANLNADKVNGITIRWSGQGTLKTDYFPAWADNGTAITYIETSSLKSTLGIKDPAEYYWANVKVSSSPNVTTTPTFKNIILTENISYTGSKNTNSMIRFLNNTADTSGNGISIGGGGVTVIGSGESASSFQSLVSAGLEKTYITADEDIEFYTNCQTIANRINVLSLSKNGNTTFRGGFTVNSSELNTYKIVPIIVLDNGKGATTGGFVNIATVEGYFNFNIRITGGWSWGSPAVTNIVILNRNGFPTINQTDGFTGSLNSIIKLGKVTTNKWNVLFKYPENNDTNYVNSSLVYIFEGVGKITDNQANTRTFDSTTYESEITLTLASIPTGYNINSGNIGSQSVSTAAKLTSGKTINGTNFDGTANITTANWGTARNLIIGNKTQSVNGSTNVTWTLNDIGAVASKPSVSGSMNDVGSYGNSMGMINLSNPTSADTDAKKKAINPNLLTGWHHFINMSFSDTNNNAANPNMWQTQIANKAGTTDLWIRSRAGGKIVDGTAWAAPWTRIITAGSVLDEEELKSNLTVIERTITPTVNWTSTGITSTNIPNSGTYIVLMFANDSGDSLANVYYSGVMSWYKDATSDTDTDEIQLHATGKSYGKRLYLRTAMASSGSLSLLIAADSGFSGTDKIIFKFKRII